MNHSVRQRQTAIYALKTHISCQLYMGESENKAELEVAKSRLLDESKIKGP
jgi:hypothetical protein